MAKLNRTKNALLTRLMEEEDANLLKKEMITVKNNLETQISNKVNLTDIYLKNDINNLLSEKANHGVSYSKSEVNTAISSKVNSRLSTTEKQLLQNGKTLNGDTLYHTKNKPSKNDVGLSNVENKSVSEIKNDFQRSGNVQLIENDWSVGSKGTDFFKLSHSESQDSRIIGENPYSEKSILWECRPDASDIVNGGWETVPFKIDNTKMYRFSVFAKTSRDATVQLGCREASVCDLNTSIKSNKPYFWQGRLPAENVWFLIVGFVFPFGEKNLTVQGGIYNCATGSKTANVLHSFNWQQNSREQIHQSLIQNHLKPTDRQWMYHPRVDLVNGNEPSILSLLGKVSPESIGARDNSWMPTATQVKARPNTWKPSERDIPTLPQSKIQNLTDKISQIDSKLSSVERIVSTELQQGKR